MKILSPYLASLSPSAMINVVSHHLTVAGFQVILEGVAEWHSAGHIALDNIQVLDRLHPLECKGACVCVSVIDESRHRAPI